MFQQISQSCFFGIDLQGELGRVTDVTRAGRGLGDAGLQIHPTLGRVSHAVGVGTLADEVGPILTGTYDFHCL